MFPTYQVPSLTSFALVELYRPAQIGDFFSKADFPPKTLTRMSKVPFTLPLLFPLFPEKSTSEAIQNNRILWKILQNQPIRLKWNAKGSNSFKPARSRRLFSLRFCWMKFWTVSLSTFNTSSTSLRQVRFLQFEFSCL